MGEDERIDSERVTARSRLEHQSGDIRELDRRLLILAYQGVPRIDFLSDVCRSIKSSSGCEVLELWFKERQDYYRCVLSEAYHSELTFETVRSGDDDRIGWAPEDAEGSLSSRLRNIVLHGDRPHSLDGFYLGNSIYVDDLQRLPLPRRSTSESAGRRSAEEPDETGSTAVIPIKFCDEIKGVLQLSSRKPGSLMPETIIRMESAAGTLGIALMTQQAQAALRERVKELTCLYSIARVAERDGISLDGILQGIVELLPPAWQYPEITSGRITLDNEDHTTPDFQEGSARQSARIVVGGKTRGKVEVVYKASKPELDEGPFLREERNLIDAIAREIAIIVERREAAAEKAALQEQLRHADRLATIGQLAAGVAHEINEPLGSMLGFAQLARKHPQLPPEAGEDIARIEAASLHAREIVKKLMLFSRQMPPRKTQVSINRMIEDGLYFIRSRCRKSGVEIKLELASDLPEITADQSQMHQVLVNLVVNSIQAMPEGGVLTISTRHDESNVYLVVGDTGVGMSEDIVKKIFLPFFTTKQINEGTGIGLSVVHGIVTSHGGSIKVTSKPGKGTTFELALPIVSPTEEPEKDVESN